MCDYHLGSKGYPQDFECINGVAIDIDNYMEGSWDMGFVGPAPCHPHYCESCRGTGEINHFIEGIEHDDECGHCGGTGYTNQIDDSIERLTAHSQQEKIDCETCQGNGEIVTDWDRYLHGPLDENGEDAVAECPDCGGTGYFSQSDGIEVEEGA